MHLCKFEMRNFKSIQNTSFEWDDIVVLIGENNAGKSTVLQALQWFLSGGQIKDEALFLDKLTDAEHAVELIGHFDRLTEAEKQAHAVRGRMDGEKWTLKKRFWCEREENGQGVPVWKEQYYSFSSEETFVNWPASDNSWANFPADYQDLIGQMAGRGSRPSNQTREQLRELVRQQKPHLLGHEEPSWVPNPGGGGNWKSNANSIIPRYIMVKAVHDASEEAVSKEASSYGKIVSLIVEKKLMQRPEVIDLKQKIEAVLKLVSPDPAHPELQAEEIRDLQDRINKRLNQVISGIVAIKTSDLDIEPMILPSTYLVLKDRPGSVETPPGHQGHGLQRTLVMTLLQILAEIQTETTPVEEGPAPADASPRPVVLAIEEPELYMHPQMERKMRDVLYAVASQPGFQVICTTHSPVFLDVARPQKMIVRVVKGIDRAVAFFQITQDIFAGAGAESERERLRLVAFFHPTVNEVFFARRVVLLEERSALVAFERAAQLVGIFARHPELRRDVTLIDCDGKGNIPLFQKVLNHFQIPYTVIHDEDRDNVNAPAENARIAGLLTSGHSENQCRMISPTNLEGMLGYTTGKDKTYRDLKRIEGLHGSGTLPPEFLRALNWVYFGQDNEPATVPVIGG